MQCFHIIKKKKYHLIVKKQKTRLHYKILKFNKPKMMNEKEEDQSQLPASSSSYFNSPQTEAPFTSNITNTNYGNNRFNFSLNRSFIISIDGILRLLIIVIYYYYYYYVIIIILNINN
jgi:hypothetical protein